jgi:hypothetical protein
VLREVSDANASTLAADYIPGTAAVGPLPSLSITTTSKGFTLSWPAAVGGFVLQESSNPKQGSSGWTTVNATPEVVNSQYAVSVASGSGAKFYRLYHP